MLGLCTIAADTSCRQSPRLQPSLGYSAFYDVALNPFASRATKRSQILARVARLNRRQLHGRTASRALWTSVLCVEHALPPSVRRSEFPGQPADRLRLERIRCNDIGLDVIAFGAFEQASFEAYRSRRYTFQHHPRLTTETARTLYSAKRQTGG